MSGFVYWPEALWQRGELKRGAPLCVSSEGTIVDAPPPGAQEVRLEGQLLMPGLVNAHSHAFQRLLRGRTEYVPPERPSDDFWSWREAMYQTAEALTPESLYAVSHLAFVEMAEAGITSVGEFHYLHHQPGGAPYDEPTLLAKTVVRAARDAGLRIRLLRVAYGRAGFNLPENPRQARFIDPSPEVALKSLESLRAELRDDPLATVGLAPHSVRAAPRGWLEAFAKIDVGPVHMHVAEQPAELVACRAEHGLSPVELLAEVGLLSERFTAVHGVHLTDADIAALGQARAVVCACPSTERNLGDGVVPADALLAAGVGLALGTDSQAHIDLFDEARQLEGHLRLVRGRRNVLDPRRGKGGLGQRLLEIATAGGARSLGLGVGALAPGESADFLSVSLGHPTLLGADPEQLLSMIGLFAPKEAVAGVWVNGERIVEGGRHRGAEAAREGFRRVLSAS